MVNVTRSFDVDRAPDVVIDYLKDFSRAEEWDPGTKTCTRRDDGPVVVGSRWHNVSEFLGRETELDYELVEMATDRLVFRGKNKTVTSTDDIAVRASSAGSRITYQATLDFKGLAKLAGPLLKLAFERIGKRTEQQMGRAINQLPG